MLVIAAAVALRHVLPATRRVARGTALVAGLGAGLVAAGIFVTDAADGFPVGTPSGVPDGFSWHAIVHGIVTPLAFVAALSASLVLAEPLGSQYGRRWRLASRTMPATVVLVLVIPGVGGISLRLALATALVLGWLTAVSLRALIRERVLVDSIETATGIEVPDAVVERLGTSRRPPVRVTVNGYMYPSTVTRMGGRYLVPVSAAVRAAAHVDSGDTIDVVLVLDLTRSAGGRAR